MKYWNRWLLLSLLLLFPLSLQAKPGEESGQETICFCHNVTHNPHTICTADPGLINAHMDHVNGEVPGTEDSLGECPVEPDPSGGPVDDGDGEPGDDDNGDNGEIDAGGPGDDSDGEEAEPPAKDQEGIHDAPVTGEVQNEGGANAGGGGLLAMEGSGCSLNAAASGAPGSAWTWAMLAAFPLLWTRRR